MLALLPLESSKILNNLRDFTLWLGALSCFLRRFLEGASIRHEVFIRGGRLIQT